MDIYLDSEDSQEIYVNIYKNLHKIFDTLCVIECDIINKKIDLDVFNKKIKDAKSLIEQQDEIPTYILIKIMKISQLLSTLNHPTLDDCIKIFQQFVKHYEHDYKKLKMMENTQNYEISKAQIFDDMTLFQFVALSPNEKYLLVGTSFKTYLYEIKTQLNLIIHKYPTEVGLFSQNSKYIILVTFFKRIIINIDTRKKFQYINKYFNQRNNCFIDDDYLYVTQTNHLHYSDHTLIKIDLKSKHSIYHYKTSDNINTADFFQDLIALQCDEYFYIFKNQTRKTLIELKLSDYNIEQLFLINNNQILSRDQQIQIIIWNIDYQQNILIKSQVLPFQAEILLKAMPGFRYLYLFSHDKFQIIDQNYNFIYNQNSQAYQPFHYGLVCNSIQLCSDKIFIISQKGKIMNYNRWDIHIKKALIGMTY